ncbi:MAG: response regulator [Planctomycetes bacterium]|nr:response regulator [Planctomycetota bacterium]
MKILFLDDDPFRETLVRLDLRRSGAKIVCVRSAADAIRALEREKFDLILLDHDLEGQVYVQSGPGTGFEVAQRIPGTVNRSTRVIVHTMNEDGARKMIEAIGSTAEWVPFSNLQDVLQRMRA